MVVRSPSTILQSFLVYLYYSYCMLPSRCEASLVEDEKDAIRVRQKALHHLKNA